MRKVLEGSAYLPVAALSLLLVLTIYGSTIGASALIDIIHQPPAIILFIGDGMGESHREAARWASIGQDGQLIMDSLLVSGWARTNNAADATTDSAAGATALASGQKTFNGRIGLGMDMSVLRTILEQAQAKGWAVGLITTTPLAHATPGAFAAHEMSRESMTNIAPQILGHEVNVILAGGEDDFLPLTETGCYPEPGERKDERNLITEAQNNAYIYVCDEAGLTAVQSNKTTHLLGLFADKGMQRPYSPSLEQMTKVAIDILSQDPDGFFLLVEGGQIDWAAHSNEAEDVIADVLGLDAAVAKGLAYAQGNANTLIIVTADHETGGMTVDLDASGKSAEDGPFQTPNGIPFYINWTSIDHTSADVPTNSQGDFSDQLSGVFENILIYDVMEQFLEVKTTQ